MVWPGQAKKALGAVLKCAKDTRKATHLYPITLQKQ
jgi:hypothetical protein